MILKELLKKHSVRHIEKKLLELFPEEEYFIKNEEYLNLIKKLLRIKPTKSNLSIIVEKVNFEFYNGVDVSGIDKSKEDNVRHGLQLTPWDIWLGMEIDKKSFENFSEIEVLAYCLDEMTYFGFDEEEKIKTSNKIEKMIEDIENNNTGNFKLVDAVEELNALKLEENLNELNKEK